MKSYSLEKEQSKVGVPLVDGAADRTEKTAARTIRGSQDIPLAERTTVLSRFIQ
jgi:hypothetical protein